MLTPGGSPVASQVYGAEPPVAASVKPVSGMSTIPDLAPGFVAVSGAAASVTAMLSMPTHSSLPTALVVSTRT